MRIDRSEPVDEPHDVHTARHVRSAISDLNVTDKGSTVDDSGPLDQSRNRPGSTIQAERSMDYRALVDAACRQYAIDHSDNKSETLERETSSPAVFRVDAESQEPDPAGTDEHLRDKGRTAEVIFPKKAENIQASGGDVTDDPRNHDNPKTGRVDASWSVYDRAIAAARDHSGGDLGPDSIKMYDYSPRTGEGTGTLIGEQTPDRLRGWRIDGQDGHVNWWDWTGGKKGAGGAYGHDWFPPDPPVPGSRCIGWAPWQDNDGNILDGN